MTDVREVQVTFDCADPRALSLFWNEVLGYEFPPPPPGFDSWDAFSESLPPDQRNSASVSVDPGGAGPRIFFQQVPEGKSVKNRVHLDVRAAPGLQGEERMAALGATPVGTTPEAAQDFVRAEVAKWQAVVTQAGIEKQ